MKIKNIHAILITLLLFFLTVQFCFSKESVVNLDSCSNCNNEKNIRNVLLDDSATTVSYVKDGFLGQFSKDNATAFIFASASIGYILTQDDQLRTYFGTGTSSFAKNISSLAILFNIPILPVSFYALGRQRDDKKMISFSQEYLATLIISLVEANLISAIPIHKRPSPDNINFWEKNFRYESSFPSGHVMGYAAFGIKTFQYYGPYKAFIPLLAGFITSYERVASNKHYVSDIAASWFLTFFASEGVRKAVNYSGNHKAYKWLFENDISFNISLQSGVFGGLVSMNF